MSALVVLALALGAAPGQGDCARGKELMSRTIELPRGRWSDEVYARLVELIARRGQRSPSWDPCARPLAVFDFDNTTIAGDLGDAALAVALEEGAISPEGPLLEALLAPLAPAHAEALRGSWPRARWPAPAEAPPELRWRVHRAYEDLCRERGNAVGYPWLTQVFAGWTDAALAGFAERAIEKELARPVGVERVEGPGDPVTLARGIRTRPEMGALMATLEANGFDVFVVTASAEWLVRAFAPRIGLPRERVIGMRTVATSSSATAVVAPPITYRAGKVAAIRTRIPPGGRVPSLVVGDSLTDLEMLEEASDLALFIDRGDATVRARAEARGWAVMPPFELEPPRAPAPKPAKAPAKPAKR